MRNVINPVLGIAIACVLVIICERDTTRNLPDPVKVTPAVNTAPEPAKVSTVSRTAGSDNCLCLNCKCNPAKSETKPVVKLVANQGSQCRQNVDGTWSCPQKSQPAAKSATCGPCGQASGPVRRVFQRQPVRRFGRFR